MAAMLRGLVAEIADELISALPPIMAARAEPLRDGLYRKLRDARLLEHAGLVALLLRRADEQQLSGHAHRGDQTLAALVSDADASVSEAAMALTIARGRRRDKFSRLGIEFDDLAAEDAVVMVHAVAAALRHGLPDDDELALAVASQILLGRHDEGRRLEAAIAALARALEAVGRADDAMVRQLAQDGDAALLAGLLARRAGIDQIDTWQLFTTGEAMMLARLAGCDRATAAQILAAFEPLSNTHAAARLMDRFDNMDDASVEQQRRWLRLDPKYRSALKALGRANG